MSNSNIKVLVDRNDIVSIADAVRSKNGTTEEMTLGQIVTGIEEISGGSSGEDEPYVKITSSSDGTTVKLCGFTEIPDDYFSGWTKLLSVDFSGSPALTKIGRRVFKDCTSLVLTSLPASVNNIAASAFEGCTGLVHVEIGAATLGQTAFKNCTGLESVWIRSTCTSISAGLGSFSPFVGCSNLNTIYSETSGKLSGWGNYWNNISSGGKANVVYNTTTCPW